MVARTVLHDADITRALRRIAHEVLESRRGDGRLVFLGIPTRGATLAEHRGRGLYRALVAARAQESGYRSLMSTREEGTVAPAVTDVAAADRSEAPDGCWAIFFICSSNRSISSLEMPDAAG